jgi:hypothetical protein
MSIPTSRPMWKNGQLVISLVEWTITLGYFGHAIKPGNSVKFKVQSPATYCAPEHVYNADPSFAPDMWSYMCIFAELYLGFSMFASAAHSATLDFTVRTLRSLPLSWKGSYKGDGRHDEPWYD